MCDGDDACPGGDDAIDTDDDRRPDACDNCPLDSNGDQRDEDRDGAGDECDCEPLDAAISPMADEVCDNADDCDDANDAVHGAAVEICDAIDNDCDGAVDEDLADCATAGDADAKDGGCGCDNGASPTAAPWPAIVLVAGIRRRVRRGSAA